MTARAASAAAFTSRGYRSVPAAETATALPTAESGYIRMSDAADAVVSRALVALDFEAGWNQGRGRPVTRRALSVALVLLAQGADFGLPTLSPLEDGGVLLEWESGSKALQVEISSLGAASYGAIENDELTAEGPVTSLWQLLEWLAVQERPNALR